MIIRVAKSINFKIGDVYVATDSKIIVNFCKKNIEAIITNKNIKSGTDRVFAMKV